MKYVSPLRVAALACNIILCTLPPPKKKTKKKTNSIKCP